MDRGLLKFKLRQNWLGALYVMTGMLFFGWMMVGAYNAFDMSQMMQQLGGAQDLMGAFIGTKGVLMWGISAFLAMAWRHPLILVVIIGYSASLGAGFAAKEVGEKTADLLFSRPVTRTRLLINDLIVSGGLLFLVTMVFSLALYCGAAFLKLNPPAVSNFVLAGLQYFAFALSILTLSYWVGGFVREGKTVISVVSGVLTVMYTIEIVGGLWDKVEPLRNFSLFTYLTTLDALQGKANLWHGMAVLFSVAIVSFVLAQRRMEKRDLT
ncbi:MAG: hypothetical protein Q8N36_06480 [bacterium]|nr:hypothetical protein [bacterium]